MNWQFVNIEIWYRLVNGVVDWFEWLGSDEGKVGSGEGYSFIYVFTSAEASYQQFLIQWDLCFSVKVYSYHLIWIIIV